MVAENQIYLAIQSIKNFSPFSWTAQTEITQVKNSIIQANCIIPIGDNRFIHHFHILKRSVAETNDISVIKVGIRCKKYLTAIKFIIHFFSIYVHRCTLIICLSITHQTEMTEKHRKITVTNGYKNKIVGKFGKDSPTIQFIFSIRGRINYTMLCSSLESIYNTRFNAKDMNTQYRFRAFVTPNCDLR